MGVEGGYVAIGYSNKAKARGFNHVDRWRIYTSDQSFTDYNV